MKLDLLVAKAIHSLIAMSDWLIESNISINSVSLFYIEIVVHLILIDKVGSYKMYCLLLNS
jgi:hypothetical protein